MLTIDELNDVKVVQNAHFRCITTAVVDVAQILALKKLVAASYVTCPGVILPAEAATQTVLIWPGFSPATRVL